MILFGIHKIKIANYLLPIVLCSLLFALYSSLLIPSERRHLLRHGVMEIIPHLEHL